MAAVVSVPTCHPERRLFNRTLRLCTECYLDRRALLKQAKRPDYPGRIVAGPARVIGVTQRAYDYIPETCPHCHGTNTLGLQGEFIRCYGMLGGCGWDAVLLPPNANEVRMTGKRARGQYVRREAWRPTDTAGVRPEALAGVPHA